MVLQEVIVVYGSKGIELFVSKYRLLLNVY